MAKIGSKEARRMAQTGVICDVCQLDPAIVAKAVPFYLEHLRRSREGMRQFRAKKKKKRKAKNTA